MNWFKEHWRKLVGYTCAAAVAVLPWTPLGALSAPLALVCANLLTVDYFEGQRVVEMATPAIRAAKDALVAKKKGLPLPLP